jgi:hypothetical protein
MTTPTRDDFEQHGSEGQHAGNWMSGTSPCSCPKCGFCYWKADDKRDERWGWVGTWDGRTPVFRCWVLEFGGKLWSAYECLDCGFYGQCVIEGSCNSHTLPHQQMCHMHDRSILY